MTAKDLLDAASVLDDKYIQEAEARAAAVVPAKRRNIRIISGITAAMIRSEEHTSELQSP